MARGTAPGEAAEDLREQLLDRLGRVGRSLGSREASHRESLEAARKRAHELHGLVADALGAFHESAAAAGASHLEVKLEEPHLDDKHVRAIEFCLRRGRHVGIVTVKSRGEVTLVGPFRSGKTEGPCRSFPMDADAELQPALGDFLERFLEEAVTP